jgi:K+-dependent Na+/Ca+ exchanger-like protein
VPALEVVAEQLELSNDVAGATLMAAGGSAPELATAFVGTFKRSDVGFGTIVGSAVFNVLFVIGMCVMFTPEAYSPLKLTWWPLFRDCTYYTFTLATLAYFMYDGIIFVYEAGLQLCMYLGYVYMMMNNDRVESWFMSKVSKKESKVSPTEGTELTDLEEASAAPTEEADEKKENGANFTRPSTFRVGILQLLTSKTSITETAGIAFVSKIKGDVNDVFAKIDRNGNGQLEKEELRVCLLELGTPEVELTDDHVQEMMDAMDKEKKGYVTKASFTIWYTGNEQRLKNQTREIFNKYDTDKSPPGTVLRTDIIHFMKELGHGAISASHLSEIEEAAASIVSTCKDQHCLTFDDFRLWYEQSMFWEAEKISAEAAVDAQSTMWQGVVDGFSDLMDGSVPFSAKFNYLLTLPLSLCFCLIPDCRAPGRDSWAVATLLGSIVMIAIFAIMMVELAEIFGASLGIPDVVMGLTILAAGTSVPDLLSSVIVAQQGQGDMAVSSSIGSNIFDIGVGLPVPWLTFGIVAMVNKCNCFVIVGSDGLFTSIVILLGMVALIVVIIHLSNWEMNHALGYLFFFFYFAYVGISLYLTPAEDYKVTECSPFDPYPSD